MSRPPRAALLSGGVAAALLIGYLAIWLGVSRLEIGRSDFTSTYVGATLLRHGHAAQLYDESLQTPLHSQLIAPGDHQGNLPFVNPPGAALLALPVTLLDLPTAYRVWSLLQLVLIALGVAAAVRAAPWAGETPRATKIAAWLAGTAGAGAASTLLLGQWDGLVTLGVGMAYASWRRDRGMAAGAWLGAIAALTKPHLFFGVAVFLLARRDRRALGGAGAALACIGAMSLLLVGPQGLADFARLSLGGTDRWPLAGLLGFTGLFGSWLGNAGAAYVLAALAGIAALAGCASLGARSRTDATKFETALAGTMALTLVMSPHLLGHDLALLAPAAAWMLARTTTRQRALMLWILLNAVAVFDFGNARMAPPGRLVPIVLAFAGIVALQATGGIAVPARLRRRAATPRLAYSGSGSGAGGVVDQS